MSEITIDKNSKQITFMNNGIAYSQFGVATEILDLIENQAREIERLNKELAFERQIKKEAREYIEEMNVWCIEFENFGVESKGLLEILDKGSDKDATK